MNRILKVATVFIVTFAAGLVGMLFVGSGVASWYSSLAKAPFTPPALAFPFIWIVLYVLMALACSYVWTREPQNAHTESWVRFYFIQLLFNGGWTVFFFGFHAITLTFIETLFLGFMVLGLTASGKGIHKNVSYLMLPYILWLFFAAYFVAGIWLLN